jgi:hypothetical protein
LTGRPRAWTPQLGALLASGALVIGSLAPWEASAAGAQLGVEGAGVYTLLLALAAGLLSIPRKPWPTIVLLVGLLCCAITIVNIVDVAGSTREPTGLDPSAVEIGWGLWLATLSSIALASTALSLRREAEGRPARSPRPRTGAVGWAQDNPALFGLLVLLALGLVLRAWLTFAWSPAFTGYSDSGIYFQGAFESIWADPIRMVGYSMFLEAIHAVTPHLIAVVVVQHAMGLAAAALIFFAVRRCGGPRWLGLAPAAVIALGGDELFIEHAALSDALFVFLIVTTLYATIRASEDGGWWAAVAGLSAGLAVWDRTVGLGLVAVISLWLVFNAGRPTRRTLIAGGLCLLVSLTMIGIYAGWRSAAADLPGTLTSNNAWNLYGRVAPWADCQKFDPPAGTEDLCQQTPASQRGYHSGEEYIYSEESLAQQLYGPPYLLPTDPAAMDRVQEWSEAALRGQPLDYLNAVWLDTRRLFIPNAPSYSQLSADSFIAYLLYGVTRSGENEFVESWQSNLYPDDPAPHHGNIEFFKTWEAMTRIVNFWMALMLALCIVGLWTLRGRARAGMTLFAATALFLLLFPIITKGYDYRFVIPAFAPLTAAAALGAWGLVEAITRRQRRVRQDHPLSAPAPTVARSGPRGSRGR